VCLLCASLAPTIRRVGLTLYSMPGFNNGKRGCDFRVTYTILHKYRTQ